MIKVGAMRFVAVVFVVFCINTHVLADVSFTGPIDPTTQIVVDKDEFDLKIDFSLPTIKAYYNDQSHWGDANDKETMFKLRVGGCEVEMWAEECANYVSHIRLGYGRHKKNYIDDEAGKDGTMNSFNAKVTRKKIEVIKPPREHDKVWQGDFDCIVRFDSIPVSGRYVVDVSLTGPNVAPDLITSIPGAEIYPLSTSTTTTTATSTMTTSTTSTTTTQASTSTTTIPPTTTLAPTTDPCDEAMSEPRYFCNDDGYVDDL